MNSITCRVCQTQNATGNKFCSNCGASLKPRTHITCPNCFHRNPLHLLYCDNCGTRLERSGSSTLDPAAADEGEGSGEKLGATKPFSLPTRRPGETGDLDPNQLPDWLRTGEESEAADALDEVKFTANLPPDELPLPLAAADLDDDLIPDWLVGLDDGPADDTDLSAPDPLESDSEPEIEIDFDDDDEQTLVDDEPDPLPYSAPLEPQQEVDPSSLDWLSELADINPDEPVDQPALTAEGSLGIHTALLDNLFDDEAPMAAAEPETDTPDTDPSDSAEEYFQTPSGPETADSIPAAAPVSHAEDNIDSELADLGWAKFGAAEPPDQSGEMPATPAGEPTDLGGLDTVIEEPNPAAKIIEAAEMGEERFTDWLTSTVIDDFDAVEEGQSGVAAEAAESESSEDFILTPTFGETAEGEFDEILEENLNLAESDQPEKTQDDLDDWMGSLADSPPIAGEETVFGDLELPFDIDSEGVDEPTSEEDENPFTTTTSGFDNELSPELSQLFDDEPHSDDPFATIIEQGSSLNFEDEENLVDELDEVINQGESGVDWLDELNDSDSEVSLFEDELSREADDGFDLGKSFIDSEDLSGAESDHPVESEEKAAGELLETSKTPAAESSEQPFSDQDGDKGFFEELAAMRPQTTTQVDQFSFEGAPGWFHSEDEQEEAEQYKQIGGPLDGLVGVIPIAPAVAKVIESPPPLSTEYSEESDPEPGLALWSATLDAGQSAEPQPADDPGIQSEEGRRTSFRLIYLLLLAILLILFFRLYMPSVYFQIAAGVQAAARQITALFR